MKCLTEHHLKDYEIDNLPIDKFKLVHKFCRHKFKMKGCVFLFMKILISSLSHMINTARRRILKHICSYPILIQEFIQDIK